MIDARGHQLRLIAPTSQRASEGGTATLLGKTYGFTALPISALPTSAELVSGSYTGRLGDSGEYSLTFPNVAGSKGLWREIFDPNLALQFLEILRDGVLEFVGAVQRVEIDRGKVTVSGPDAYALTRRVYERDRTWTASPRDVWDAYTRVRVPIEADDFPGNSLAGNWNILGAGGATVAGGICTSTAAGGNFAGLSDTAVPFTSDSWRAVVRFKGIAAGVLPTLAIDLTTTVGLLYGFAPNRLELQSTVSGAAVTTGAAAPITPDKAGPVTMVLERQGRWVFGYVNGVFAGVLPFDAAFSPTTFRAYGFCTSGGCTVRIDSIVISELKPFLIRGSVKGDYALPGSQPWGGLRGRYFSDADLQGLTATARGARVLSPVRTPAEERLDLVIDSGGGGASAIPPPSGNDGNYFSIRWFGSVYLRLDLGNYVFELNHADGVRAWVGKTAWGDQVIDDWVVGASRLVTGTVNAANLGAKAGWYPIVVEHKHDTTAWGIQMKFTPPGTGYTDPGGSAIVASTKIVVPQTSLSPLGCFDNRVQGTAHFDLVGQVAQQFGYQLWCEPKSLESGEFPGRLVPLARVGTDRDVVLRVDDMDGDEPLFSPGLTIDGSEQALAVIGAGAGLPDGGAQVTGEVSDLTRLTSGLFAMEQWIDAGDIGYPDLFAARIAAELALRNTPWEEVRGTPRAQERLADTWPLTGAAGAMRWRPGDGVRLNLPELSTIDTSPRQMLQVTRAFVGEGRVGTQVAFRQRPRSAAKSVRGALRSAISPQRSYQGQVIPLASEFITAAVAAAGFSAYSNLALYPTDQVLRAVLRIPLNSAAQALDVEINGTLRASNLGGTWTKNNVEIDITSYANQNSATDSRLFARIKNTGGSTTTVQFQVVVTVLR